MKSRLIHFGLAVAALLAAPVAASAADLGPGPSYKAPPYVAPSYPTWSGFYVGINGGYAFGESDWAALATDPEPDGFLIGGTIGYNLQTGVWVWGIEADAAYSTIKGDVGCAPGGTCETKVPWFATARGRIGYAGWGNIMPYFTGGAAFGSVQATRGGAEESETRIGWTVGGGLEYALMSAWSVKLEYLYADLGSFDCGACLPGPGASEVSFKSHIVRAGLNYRF